MVIGGSYAGAMSAWLRLSTRICSTPAWRPRRVVNVILDFDQFDQQVLPLAPPPPAFAPRALLSRAAGNAKACRLQAGGASGASALMTGARSVPALTLLWPLP